jgi:hypothetical protein
MNPGDGAKVLDALSSLENLSVILDIDLAGVDAIRATLGRRDFILVLLVRHIDNLHKCKEMYCENCQRRSTGYKMAIECMLTAVYIRLIAHLSRSLGDKARVRVAMRYLGIWGLCGWESTCPIVLEVRHELVSR